MTREEAIKILMGYSYTPQERAALETLIPELAESEDERIRKEIIEYLWDISNQTPLVKESLDCRRWIAYLEKQKEQKPAEWSEEDERILKGIIGKIDHDQTYGVSKVEMLSFLRTLRPSWKPSEEQLKELNKARRFIPYNCDILESLYNQLKSKKGGII